MPLRFKVFSVQQETRNTYYISTLICPVQFFQTYIPFFDVHFLAFAEMITEVNACEAGPQVLIEVIDISIDIGFEFQSLRFKQINNIQREVEFFLKKTFLEAKVKSVSWCDLV